MEAIDQATKLLENYPGKLCSPQFRVMLAEVLSAFPREVAIAAASPVNGVVREVTEFIPTTGQVANWCKREAEFLYRQAERDQPRLPAPASDRSKRLTYDELMDRHPYWRDKIAAKNGSAPPQGGFRSLADIAKDMLEHPITVSGALRKTLEGHPHYRTEKQD
jgi:hypothetical protein